MKKAWLKISPILVVLSGACATWAAPAPYRVVLMAKANSGDYLKHVEMPQPEKTLNSKLFSGEMSTELRMRYNTLQDDFEKRRNYGFDQMEDQLRYREANKSLVTSTMYRLLEDNIRRPMRRLVVRTFRDTIRHRNETPAELRKKLQESAQAGDGTVTETGDSETPGTPEEPNLSIEDIYHTVENFYNEGLMIEGHTHMRFQYDIPSGILDLKFRGALIDTSFNYFVMPLNFSATGGGFSGNTINPERAAFSVSKSLEEIGLSTAMRYGLMSRSFNAGMNKHLVGPLNAGINQLMNATDSSKNETTYRLDMGLSF